MSMLVYYDNNELTTLDMNLKDNADITSFQDDKLFKKVLDHEYVNLYPVYDIIENAEDDAKDIMRLRVNHFLNNFQFSRIDNNLSSRELYSLAKINSIVLLDVGFKLESKDKVTSKS